MKPYKVASTWIDLDHVLGMDDEPYVSYSMGPSCALGGVQMAFRDSPIYINLGPTAKWDGGNQEYVKDESLLKVTQETWEAFKTAWKTRDTMFGGSK